MHLGIYVYAYTNMYVTKLMEKEAINLKENRGSILGVEGEKKGGTVVITY